jgi:hypothetical protein
MEVNRMANGIAPLVRLGRKRYVNDRRTLRFARYRTPQLPAPPDSFDVSQGILDWKMLANDRLGDCTAAGAAHLEMVWSRIAGNAVDPNDADVIDFYHRVTSPPFDPDTGANDDGAVELFVCQEWRKNGIANRRIHAYVYVEPKHLDQLHQATWLFSGSYLGIALPISAQTQDVWDDTGQQIPNAEPGSWGGHCVVVVGRDKPAKLWTIVTWGRLKQVTDAFLSRYLEEAWVMVAEDFATLSGPNAASGFDFDTLNADLAAIG